MSGDARVTWYATVSEDGTFSVLARVTALEGTGTEVRPSEGSCVKQVDVSGITGKVFSLGTNKNNPAGTEIIPSLALTPTDNIYDTLQTSGWPTEEDWAGYNFRHNVSATYVPNPDEWYLIEYIITLTGGGVAWLRVKVKTIGNQS